MSSCSRPLIRLGFIGGSLSSAVGHTHFSASRLDGYFSLEAGCFSRHDADNHRTACAYGVSPQRTYANWHDLLDGECDRLDAIVILTPTPSHAEIAITALDKGFAVICEKALGTSSRECQDIGEAVMRNRGYLAVTFNYSGYPMVRELQRLIREGLLGRIQQIHVEMPQEGYLRTGANPQDWRRHDYAVPTVSLDLGVHVHHLVDFLTGYQPVEVMADQTGYGPFPGLIDNVYCLAHYEHGVRLQAWWGKSALGYRNGLRLRVFGDLASAEWYQMQSEILQFADNEGGLHIIDRAAKVADVSTQPRYNRFKAGHPSGFIEAFANLYTDIADDIQRHRNGESDRNEYVFDAAHAGSGLRLMEAINQSALEHRWSTVPA